MVYPISWEFAWPYLLAALTGGYFLGAIPFGLVLTKMAGLGDVRNIGSGLGSTLTQLSQVVRAPPDLGNRASLNSPVLFRARDARTGMSARQSP